MSVKYLSDFQIFKVKKIGPKPVKIGYKNKPTELQAHNNSDFSDKRDHCNGSFANPLVLQAAEEVAVVLQD